MLKISGLALPACSNLLLVHLLPLLHRQKIILEDSVALLTLQWKIQLHIEWKLAIGLSHTWRLVFQALRCSMKKNFPMS
jgi:hypothetical protein